MNSNNIGSNIGNAVKVLQQTYENINRLLNEMDTVGSKEGFISITPKFLRWKSDAEPSGWFIRNFIKLYQRKEDPDLDNESGYKDGPIYGVEVNLEEDEPQIYLGKFIFEMDPDVWRRLPAVSEHWRYYNPTVREDYMKITQVDNLTIAVPLNEKSSKSYNGIQEVRYTGFNLVSLDSREKVKTMIFDELMKL